MPRVSAQLLSQNGFTLVEILISGTLFSILLIFFLLSSSNLFRTQAVTWDRVEGSWHAQNGMEEIINVFENTTNWEQTVDTFSAYENFHLVRNPNLKIVNGSVQINDMYEQKASVSPVHRDRSSYRITESSGDETTLLDPNTVQVKVMVSWESNGEPVEIEYESYAVRK